MAGLSTSALISQIRQPRSLQEHLLALKLIKNDIIGSQHRKDVWMASGVLEAVVDAATSRAPYTIDCYEPPNTLHSHPGMTGPENVRLQSLAVLGSFASGGLKFVDALLSASALPAVLSGLCPKNNPPQLVLAALRVLSALAKSSLLSMEPHPSNLLTLADALFSENYVASLSKILHQSCKSIDVDTQISYTASLISSLCSHERHRESLASAGLVEAFAGILATVVISQGLAIPRPGLQIHVEDLLRESPLVHPERADIGGILQALAVIIGDSKARAYSLVGSSTLQGIWQHGATTPSWTSMPQERSRSHNAIDLLNPQAPSSKPYMASSLSNAFPPLGSRGFLASDLFSPNSQAESFLSKRSDYVELSSGCSTPKSSHETESPLISYLIWSARSSEDILGLMSAYLLVVLYKAGMADQHREAEIGLMVVPLLVRCLEGAGRDPSASDNTKARSWVLEALAPVVLAKLVLDSERLQKAAYDAGAIPRLCKILRSSYQPIKPALDGGSWSPQNAEFGNAPSSMSEIAVPPLLVHKIKLREGVLKAIAALISFKEEYRKAVVDQGVMGVIVDSLKPSPGNEQGDESDGRLGTKEMAARAVCDAALKLGINPVPVLAAACATLRQLSRSPSILRTTLVDSGVVLPIFELLSYPDVEVQIAATAAVCNIVTEMSPMRQAISDAGVSKILCQHAHSKNVSLRYNALWALKHFVQSAGNEDKKTCLRELGQEWLVRLICGDMEDDDLLDLGSAAKESIGRDIDVLMGSVEGNDDYQLSSYAQLELNDGKGVGQDRLERRPYLPALSSSETFDDDRQLRRDNTRVQEQGLEFLRNLIASYGMHDNVANSDMITYLFNAKGEEDIFELLTSKLRAKVHHRYSRGLKSVNDGETRVSPPRPEILSAVKWILVNIAQSNPRHREALLRQTELLRLVLQHASHPVKDIRLAFCWLVINLSWVDNDQDSVAHVARVEELERLGFLAKLEMLIKDEDLDVRERAKTGRFQMLQRYGGRA